MIIKGRLVNKLIFICVAYLLLTVEVFAENSQKVAVETLEKTSLSWDGSELTRYLEGQPEITILRITIPAGVQLPTHKHPVINAGVLVKGELTVVTKENKTLHMKAGDTIVEVVDKWHYGKNEGDVPAEIIVFYAGVKGQVVTIKE